MAQRMYRAQILLTPDQHRRLRELAKQANSSISEVTRSLLDMALRLQENSVQSKLERVQAARETAAHILRERGGKVIETDIASLIRQAREERAHDLGSH